MTKTEYLESQRGKLYSLIIKDQPTELVQGSLLKTHYQEIKTILASGLQHHLNTFDTDTTEKQIALTALLVTFDPIYLANEDFKVNFNIPAVMNNYLFCISTGALPQEYATALIDLAKYPKFVYDISREDCATYFGPDWIEIEPSNLMTLRLQLRTAAPEQTYIVVQAQDQYDDGTVSDWYHATAMHGIELVRQYQAPLPHNGYPRKLRWKCEYQLDAVVTVA